MPRATPTVQHVFIADGFADDCEELIHRCSRVDQLNYPTFCAHYKEMNLATVFQHRSTNAEIGELTEELLQIAKHYMVRDTSNFEESVVGLFIVYALLNLQPFPRFAALRLVQDDLPTIARIERVARRDNRLDVLYVLAHVLVKGPVQFHADARPRGMEIAFRKNLEGYSNIDAHGVRPKGVYTRQNEELDILRDMNSIFERYKKAKAQIPGFQRRDEGNSNLAVELSDSLKRVINGIAEDPGVCHSVADHHDTVQEIKKRAMRHTVATVRHLDSADQRQRNSKKSVDAHKDMSKSPGNRRERLFPESAKRKSPKKTKPKSFCFSSDSEDEKEIEMLAKDVMSQPGFREIIKYNEQHTNLDITSLPRLITTETDGKLYEIEIIDEMKHNSLPFINDNDGKIEIELIDEMKQGNLPPIMNCENDGKFIEVEILDQVKCKNDMTSLPTTEVREENVHNNKFVYATKEEEKEKKKSKEKKEEKEKKGEKLENSPKKKGRAKKNDKSPKSEVKRSNNDLNYKHPLRVSPRLKQVLKRDQKKPILKSKFKKMGMLEVANFEEKK